jgi:diguanylate cyclase (GGDEF)-like protein
VAILWPCGDARIQPESSEPAFKAKLADVDLIGVRPSSIGISTRFFVALFVLSASLVAVGTLGLRGLQDVQHVNNQVFADNLVTAEASSRLALDLANAERIGLELTATNNAAEIDALRAELDLIAAPQVNSDVAKFVRLHAKDPLAERAELQRIPTGWRSAAQTERRALASVGGSFSERRRAQAADSIADTMDPLILYVAGREPIEREAAADARAGAQTTYNHDRTWLIIVAIVAGVAAMVMLLVGATLKRMVDQRARDKRFEESGSEYIETLQVTENEDEAHELLRRQVERAVEGARAVVLVRNNSADRLEAKTPLPSEIDTLRDPLTSATPRSCLAVRFGRGHNQQTGDEALLSCQICGALPGASTCEPLLVGGEVIGAVLIAHPDRLDKGASQRIRETVAQAAPVLANLRNLAIAQLQAATDSLTGLSNRRAVQDTLKRMVAQSARAAGPLAALLLDLDHFKKINDTFGHDCGDEVLAAVGVALRDAVRDSDFVGRYGGEEFLLLLPDTEKQGALEVAEAIRKAVATIHTPNLDQITASIGVAVLPDDAGDATTLVRSADRALYSAKKNGRDRVETVASEEYGPIPVATAPNGE